MSDEFAPYYQNGRLEKEFTDLYGPDIGHGTFGTVIRCRHRIDRKYYAIKKILFDDETQYQGKIRELQVWAMLDSDTCVQYRSSWLETEPNGDIVLLIQMDLCWFSLTEAIKRLNKYFGSERQLLTPLPYYIVSELMIEMIEGIEYLHNSKPPIIHRDIKPDNVVIRVDRRNGRFVKLADFGISVPHECESQTHTAQAGTERFMAPEVKSGRKYGTKADIYSVGVVFEDVFHFDINRYNPQDLIHKYPSLIKQVSKLLNGEIRCRPDCADVLREKNEWAMSLGEVIDEAKQWVDMNRVYENDELVPEFKTDFVPFFLQTKLNYHKSL